MLNEEEFVAEVDAAIEASLDASDTPGDVTDDGASKSNDSPADNETQVDTTDVEGKGGSSSANGGEAVDGEGSSGDDGDQGGDRELEEGNEAKAGKVVISDSAIEQAVRAGISIADARSFANEESLNRVVITLIEGQQAVSAADAGLIANGDSDADEKDLSDKIPDLDPEEFEPKTLEMFSAMNDIIKQQQEQIRDIIDHQGATEESQLAAQAAEIEGWFDREIAGLGKDFSAILGDGGSSSLQSGSSQLAKRIEISGNIEVLLAGYNASGKAVPPRSEIFASAARSVLHKEFSQIANKKLTGELEKRSKQHMPRGSGGRADSQVSVEDEIAQALDQKFPASR